MHRLWTLGHSTLAPADFITLIKDAGIEPAQGDLFLPGGNQGPSRVDLARQILADKHAWRTDETTSDHSDRNMENP